MGAKSDMQKRILAINTGSTSTKIALYDGDVELFTEVIRHDRKELELCGSILGQKDVRMENIRDILEKHEIPFNSIDAISSRGGLLRPMESGVYKVNDRMIEYLYTNPEAFMHASSLAAVIAKEMADQTGIGVYIVDPAVVDEMEPCARISGLPEIERVSTVHALNHKEIARRYACQVHADYEDLRLVIAHMGGGISVAAHKNGRIIDTNNALVGEGPLTPERPGQLPAEPLVKLCFSGKYTEKEITDMVTRNGGMQRYIGTSDMLVAEQMIADGDEKAALVVEAMAYQVSKEIGAMAAVLDGQVDAILLTGGLAYSKHFTTMIKQKVEHFAPVCIFPGEDEMLALKNGVLRVLTGVEVAKEY